MGQHAHLYKTKTWHRLRWHQLQQQPLCHLCQQLGRTTAATGAGPQEAKEKSMNDRDLTIALYRDGLPARVIKQKMQLTTEQYREYVADEPKRAPKPRAPRKSGYKINKPDSPAKQAGLAMLREGATVAEVVERLSYMGLSAHESTVTRWKLEVRGTVNCRVPQRLYPELRQIITDNPHARGTQVAQIYNKRTGLRLDRRAAQHWCKKVRAVA